MTAAWPGEPAVVLIDGRAGSGKTTLGARLAAALGADTLHLDDLYPGWAGLARGSRAVVEALRTGHYRAYDWERGAFGVERLIDPDRALVIEGCGAVTARNLAAARQFAARRFAAPRSVAVSAPAAPSSGVPAADGAVWSIWVDCPDALRRERAHERDGDLFAPHWSDWAQQERAHFAAERPIALVDEILHSRV